MCDDWMPTLRFNLSREQFDQLPRNSAYRYEYISGQTYLSPRPRHYHAQLELAKVAESTLSRRVKPETVLRPLRAPDWAMLEPVFSGAFRSIQPFGSLDHATRRQAARNCLDRTRTGGDGPWIEHASFVAEQGEELLGTILITLLPEGDPCDWDSYRWQEPPPGDYLIRRAGRPHLTWIFVKPGLTGNGLGSSLLAAASRELLALGYQHLLSTFMLGNDSSMLWHWRNGFQLLAYPGSLRYLQKR